MLGVGASEGYFYAPRMESNEPPLSSVRLSSGQTIGFYGLRLGFDNKRK